MYELPEGSSIVVHLPFFSRDRLTIPVAEVVSILRSPAVGKYISEIQWTLLVRIPESNMPALLMEIDRSFVPYICIKHTLQSNAGRPAKRRGDTVCTRSAPDKRAKRDRLCVYPVAFPPPFLSPGPSSSLFFFF